MFTIKKQREIGSGTFTHTNKRGPIPRLNEDHLNFISMCLKENGESSANELCVKLKAVFGVTVSSSTVKMARQKLGWVSTTQAYCQTVREAKRPKRLEYALRSIRTQEKFLDVIFTDESTVKIQTSTGKCFVQKGEEKQMKPKPTSISSTCVGREFRVKVRLIFIFSAE